MKPVLTFGMICFAVCTVLAQPPAKKKQAHVSGDEVVLTQLESEWGMALVKVDFATIDRIVAPDWILTTPDGVQHTKAEIDADLKSGKIKFESFKVDELNVRLYGNAAVLFGLTTEKLSIEGQDMSGQNRFTDTFIKRDGKWQCVATHVTAVAKK